MEEVSRMASHLPATAQGESNKTKSIKEFSTIINKLLRVGFWVVKLEGELGENLRRCSAPSAIFVKNRLNQV